MFSTPITATRLLVLVSILVYGQSVCIAGSVEVVRDSLVQHLRKSYPVTGKFRLIADADGAMQDALLSDAKRTAKEKGLELVKQPLHTDVHFRWSWDGSRELFEPLPGGNLWKAFYKDQTALLDGNHEKNFNLVPPKDPYPIRPLNFYFMVAPRTLVDDLESKDTVVSAGEKDLTRLVDPKFSNRHPITLKCATERGDTTIVVGTTPIALLAAEYWSGGHVTRRLIIHELKETEDGKAFPVKAEMELYLAGSDKQFKRMKMDADSVAFPVVKEDIEAAMNYVLPQGTEIYDRMLNRVSVLSSPTSAAEIIHGAIPSVPLSDIADATGFPSSQTPPAGRSFGQIVGLTITSVTIIVLIVAIIRRRAPT